MPPAPCTSWTPQPEQIREFRKACPALDGADHQGQPVDNGSDATSSLDSPGIVIIISCRTSFKTRRMSVVLQKAYETLMKRAPGAAFRRARSLYLNKYPLTQEQGNSPFRLFVCDELLEESVAPSHDGDADHRLVTLTAKARQLAVVHWQRHEAPDEASVRRFLSVDWDLDAEQLTLEAFDEPWFREGGHQTRLQPPADLIWTTQALITLRE